MLIKNKNIVIRKIGCNTIAVPSRSAAPIKNRILLNDSFAIVISESEGHDSVQSAAEAILARHPDLKMDEVILKIQTAKKIGLIIDDSDLIAQDIRLSSNTFHTDEYIKEFGGGNRMVINGGIELTSCCNMHCVHCYLRNNSKCSLPIDMVLRFLDEIADAGVLDIYLTGGEVLAYPHFKEVYIHCKERGLCVTVLSNATMVDKSIVELFKEYPVDVFSTTMYGSTEKTYETVTRCPGSFQKFIDGVMMLKNSGIKVEIKYIPIVPNAHEVLDAKKFCDENGFDFRLSTEVRYADEEDGSYHDFALTPEQILRYDILIDERLNYYRTAYTRAIPDEIQDRIDLNRVYLCSISKNSFFLDARGILHGCSRERLRGIPMEGTNFQEAWARLGDVRNLSRPIRCHTCDNLRFCHQCAAEMDLRGDVYEPIPSVCRLAELRSRLSHRLHEEPNITKEGLLTEFSTEETLCSSVNANRFLSASGTREQPLVPFAYDLTSPHDVRRSVRFLAHDVIKIVPALMHSRDTNNI